MTYYVRRFNSETNREGWVGPIRSLNQARKEQSAWIACDHSAQIIEASPTVRAEVRKWQREANARLGR